MIAEGNNVAARFTAHGPIKENLPKLQHTVIYFRTYGCMLRYIGTKSVF